MVDSTAVRIVPSGPVHGVVTAPASKSVENRVLLLAALAEGTSRLTTPLTSDDARAMRGAVTALGAIVDADGDGAWRVTGTGGRLRTPSVPIDAALSGTTLRFIAAAAALAPERVTVTGRPPLLRRPVGPLLAALGALGGDVGDAGGVPPVVAGGGLRGGAVAVDASGSSQFVSALLLVAPYAERDVTVSATGLGAAAYVTLTCDLMRRWDAAVHPRGAATWTVTAGRGYRARDDAVEYDASAAAHLFGLAVATGGAVTVRNAVATAQPDAGITDVLAAMGATVRRDPAGVTVTGPPRPLPVDVDLTAMPDQVTTIAALAALADGTSVITGVGVARGHETDRLAALAAQLGRLGVRVEQRPDGLVVQGGSVRGPARLQTYDDHRLAMAFAAIAAREPGLVIEEPGCVAKTYPAFWDDLAGLGVTLESVNG